jgi:DNA-binding IclR family transcriptional regulator
MTGRYQAPTVRQAFHILERVSRSEHGLTISELSRTLKISKSTVHGIASALVNEGALVRDATTKRYAPGLTLFKLGQSAYSRINLKDVARPFMDDLSEKTEESVFLGALGGDHVYILEVVESMQDIKITSPPGTRIPLLAGATGKALIASLPPEQASTLVRSKGLTRYTAATTTDPDAYLSEIDSVRRRGFATDNEEYMTGVRAAAAAIRSYGRPLSAIWVVGFTSTIDDGKMALIASETKRAAAAITRSIAGT